jgi:hypothetical protein
VGTAVTKDADSSVHHARQVQGSQANTQPTPP